MTRRAGRVAAVLLACSLPCAASASEAIWRGSFIAKGAETGLFSPCRSGKRYSTSDPSGEAAAAYKEIARRAGRPVFIEFIGSRESEASVRIERVLRAAASGPGCAESPSFMLRAYGASPTWRLDWAPDALLFQRAPARAVTWSAPSVSQRRGQQNLVADGEAGSIRVAITAGRCVDELAGAVFSLRAEVSFDGRTYQGCAYEGDVAGTLQKEKAPLDGASSSR